MIDRRSTKQTTIDGQTVRLYHPAELFYVSSCTPQGGIIKNLWMSVVNKNNSCVNMARLCNEFSSLIATFNFFTNEPIIQFIRGFDIACLPPTIFVTFTMDQVTKVVS